jgi:hypothetical protein
MEKKEIHILELTFCSSLLLHIMDDEKIIGIGSGVIVQYKKRYFLCTAEHLIEENKYSIGIKRGLPSEKGVEILTFDDFSFLKHIKLDGITPEDLNLTINSFADKNPIDVAIREINLPDQLIQDQISIQIEEETVDIFRGAKCFIPIDKKYSLNKKSVFCLAGMINSKKKISERNCIELKLITSMTFSNITSSLIEFNLGYPIEDYSLFKGCSGAPIFDFEGNLVALFIGGNENLKKPFVYGYRFDKIKDYIEMIYFNISLDEALKK